MDHGVTLTLFVADLSHPGLSNFNIIREIDARDGRSIEGLALTSALVKKISQDNEMGL